MMYQQGAPTWWRAERQEEQKHERVRGACNLARSPATRDLESAKGCGSRLAATTFMLLAAFSATVPFIGSRRR